MKIFISCGMEGATGLVSFCQTTPGSGEYAFGQAMQLHDVLAVVEAALEWGVEDILINDAHHAMRNMDIRNLPLDRVHLCSGFPKNFGMVEGFQDYDAAFFVAYHAMAGTHKALMDHTMGFSAFEVRLNDQPMGEAGLNAAACGAMDVPVAFLSGDDAVCWEAASLLGSGIICCPVKEGSSSSAGKLISPEETSTLLKAATRKALYRVKEGRVNPFKVDTPCSGSVTFCNTRACDLASLVPGSERLDGRTLGYSTSNVLDLYRWHGAVITIGERA